MIAIAGLGIYLPASSLSSADVAARTRLPVEYVEDVLGIRRVFMPGPDDHPCAMGVHAARLALEQAGVEARDLDLVLYVGSDYKEYINWTAALKLQNDLGATHAFAFDIHQTCTGMLMGCRVASDMMRANPAIRTVLLAGGQRGDHIDYEDPLAQSFINTSAAGGALVLRADEPGLARLLETHIITEGSICEDLVIAGAGSLSLAAPPAGDAGPAAAMTLVDPIRVGEYVGRTLVPNTVRCVRAAVERSGRALTDVRFLAAHHARPDHVARMLEELHLRPDQTVSLAEYGHLGAFDVVCALELGWQQGRLRAGDLAVCAGAGIGFSWAATAIEWTAPDPQ